MKFKSNDFAPQKSKSGYIHSPNGIAMDWCAEIANAKLEEWMKDAPVLFGRASDESISFDWTVGLSANDFKEGNKTHMARLVCIEEIKK